MRRVAAKALRDARNADVVSALVDLIGLLQRTRMLTRNRTPGEALLVHLAKFGPVRPADLAAAMQLDQSTVSRHLGHLVTEGLVERSADPVDGRAYLVRVTPDGAARAESIIGLRIAQFEQVLSTWPDEDRDAFARLLARFSKEFQA